MYPVWESTVTVRRAADALNRLVQSTVLLEAQKKDGVQNVIAYGSVKCMEVWLGSNRSKRLF